MMFEYGRNHFIELPGFCAVMSCIMVSDERVVCNDVLIA